MLSKTNNGMKNPTLSDHTSAAHQYGYETKNFGQTCHIVQTTPFISTTTGLISKINTRKGLLTDTIELISDSKANLLSCQQRSKQRGGRELAEESRYESRKNSDRFSNYLQQNRQFHRHVCCLQMINVLYQRSCELSGKSEGLYRREIAPNRDA